MKLQFLILLLVSLISCAMGFKKIHWFITIGYGFAVFCLSITLLMMFKGQLTAGTLLLCILLIAAGLRLCLFLAFREFRSPSYQKHLSQEIQTGKTFSIWVKAGIWIYCGWLYVCEISPLWFRLLNHIADDCFLWVGIIITLCGIMLKAIADLQKTRRKQSIRAGMWIPAYTGWYAVRIILDRS